MRQTQMANFYFYTHIVRRTMTTKNKLVSLRATVTLADSDIKTVTMGGRQWRVFPLIMCAEGVRNGELVKADELGLYGGAYWNGMPMVIDHPKDEYGFHISANLTETYPDVVGRVFNVAMHQSALHGEAWIDENYALSIGGKSARLLQMLNRGESFDVSIAFFSDAISEQGQYSGEDYYGIVTGMRPDHLAILSEQDGACSWREGCGIPRTHAESDNGQSGCPCRQPANNNGEGSPDDNDKGEEQNMLNHNDENEGTEEETHEEETHEEETHEEETHEEETEDDAEDEQDGIPEAATIEEALALLSEQMAEMRPMFKWFQSIDPSVIEGLMTQARSEHDSLVAQAHTVSGLPKSELTGLSNEVLRRLGQQAADFSMAGGLSSHRRTESDNAPPSIFEN